MSAFCKTGRSEQENPVVLRVRQPPQAIIQLAKKSPALGGAFFESRLVQIFRLRLANPTPARPKPKSASAPGAGTDAAT